VTLLKVKEEHIISKVEMENRDEIGGTRNQKSRIDTGFGQDYQMSKTRFGITEP